ncbi:cyclic nucleotide-gated ion channel 1-like isoform X2 [Rosa rugosa]|uniref:cyclic nucleotide-gated ion channel 1-like isoform X2 n=1 Tax=Rosa rugosa TaxID=74645 RepID=UPI002B402DA6|nr:cyclic nucleotide-gated ion channel 1-like isoform X2 [Rosa rugosa]
MRTGNAHIFGPLQLRNHGHQLQLHLLRKLKLTKGKTWERILLVISCIALAVDPLFFYIPFIDEKSKCIGMDKKLRAIVLALRSLTDLAFALNIDAQNRDPIDKLNIEYCVKGCMRRLEWLSQDMIELLVILPIPQVIIVTIFFRMNGSGYPYKTAISNVFLILQFIARGCQIYHFQKPFKRVGKWAKIAFYFLIYVLVGHIFGAFWYLLSIQREISCWHQTCRNTTGCLAINYCKDTNYSTSITLLDEFCPVNPSNATLFDFGVYLDALQSGNTGSKSFSTKYFYTFWWGIRNLSNFGTSLETSNYLWENCFTILISLVGLLLFLYLMGNVQTHILWESTIALENEQNKINSKYKALEMWMVRNGIPEEVKTGAVKIITEKKIVEKNYDDDVDLVFVFNALTGDEPDKVKIRIGLKQYLFQNAIPKVFMLKYILPQLESEQNKIFLNRALKPVVFEENNCVVKEGKSNHRMLIITEGVVVCTDNTGANVARFGKGEVYVEELLDSYPNIPKDAKSLKCETKVEAFGISCTWYHQLRNEYLSRGRTYRGSNLNEAYQKLITSRSVKLEEHQKKIIEWLSRNTIPDGLQTLVMEHIKANNVLEKNWDAEVDVKYLFSIGLSWDIEYRIKKQICINSLRKVPVLEGVDEDVLSRICMSLEPLVLPQHSCIFYPLSAIDRMLIVVEGEITVTETTYNRQSTKTERGNVERMIKKSDVIGEELLTWAFPIVSESSESYPAILEKYVECPTKVEAFALTIEGLESVVAYYRHGINKFEQLEKGRDGVADTKGASRSTTTIDQRLDRLIQLQSDMAQQHRDEMANQGRKLDEILSRLGYPAGTSPPPAA